MTPLATCSLGLLVGIVLGILIAKAKSKIIDPPVLAITACLATAAIITIWHSGLENDKKVLAVVAIVAASGTWYSGIIATRNVFESATRQRSVNTMQALVALENADVVAARRLVRQGCSTEPDEETELEHAAFLVLNRLEDIATLVNADVLDNDICKASLSEWVAFYWTKVRPTLDPARVASYTELPKLCARWERPRP